MLHVIGVGFGHHTWKEHEQNGFHATMSEENVKKNKKTPQIHYIINQRGTIFGL
jgi:hypothetical protein